jgi:hypothetical protein
MRAAEWRFWLAWSAWVLLLWSVVVVPYVLASVSRVPDLTVAGRFASGNAVVALTLSRPAARAIEVRYRINGADPGRPTGGEGQTAERSETIAVGTTAKSLTVPLPAATDFGARGGRDVTVEILPGIGSRLVGKRLVVFEVAPARPATAPITPVVPGKIPMLELKAETGARGSGQGGGAVSFVLDRPPDRPLDVPFEVDGAGLREEKDFRLRGATERHHVVFSPGQWTATVSVETLATGVAGRMLRFSVPASTSVLLGEVTTLEVPLRPGGESSWAAP